MATMLTSSTNYGELIQSDRISGRVYYDAAHLPRGTRKNLVSRMGLCRA